MSEPRRLVVVTWVDSMGCASTWSDIEEEMTTPALPTCRSVGWVAHDSETCIVVVPHVATHEDHELDHGCGDMTIPRAAVVSVEDLVKAPA